MIHTTFLKNKLFNFIVHLADIHIPNKHFRFDEYNNIFKYSLPSTLTSNKLHIDETLIIICGDIFHDAKSDLKLSKHAIELFSIFIDTLCTFGTVVVIPGNHDNEINCQNSNNLDVLESVIKPHINTHPDKLFYLKHTGIYEIGNCVLYHTSVFDLDKNTGKEKYSKRISMIPPKINKDEYHHIGIIHCSVQGVTLQNKNHLLNGYMYKLEDIDKYDYTLLGDIHQHQFLNNHIAYPSSLIQQNFGESIDQHGYILWDLNKKIGKFFHVKNKYGYIKIKLDSDDDIDNILQSIKYPENTYIQIVQNFIGNLKENKIYNIISSKTNINSFNCINKSLLKKKSMITEDVNEFKLFNKISDFKLFTDYVNMMSLKDPQLDELKADIIEMHENKFNNLKKYEKLSYKWEIQKIYFNYFLCFEKETIDFNQINNNTIIAINGANAQGKSTILDGLDFVIWGNNTSFELEMLINNKLININTQKKLYPEHCYVELYFKFNNINHKLRRKIEISTIRKKNTTESKLKIQQKLQIWEQNTDNKSKKQWEEKTLTKANTEKLIIDIFGTRKHSTDTFISKQNEFNSFIQDKHNINILSDHLNCDIFESIKDECKSDKNNINTELKVKCNELNTIKSILMNSESFDKPENIILDLKKEYEESINNKIKINNDLKELEQRYFDMSKEYANVLDVDADDLNNKRLALKKMLKESKMKLIEIDDFEKDFNEEFKTHEYDFYEHNQSIIHAHENTYRNNDSAIKKLKDKLQFIDQDIHKLDQKELLENKTNITTELFNLNQSKNEIISKLEHIQTLDLNIYELKFKTHQQSKDDIRRLEETITDLEDKHIKMINELSSFPYTKEEITKLINDSKKILSLKVCDNDVILTYINKIIQKNSELFEKSLNLLTIDYQAVKTDLDLYKQNKLVDNNISNSINKYLGMCIFKRDCVSCNKSKKNIMNAKNFLAKQYYFKPQEYLQKLKELSQLEHTIGIYKNIKKELTIDLDHINLSQDNSKSISELEELQKKITLCSSDIEVNNKQRDNIQNKLIGLHKINDETLDAFNNYNQILNEKEKGQELNISLKDIEINIYKLENEEKDINNKLQKIKKFEDTINYNKKIQVEIDEINSNNIKIQNTINNLKIQIDRFKLKQTQLQEKTNGKANIQVKFVYYQKECTEMKNKLQKVAQYNAKDKSKLIKIKNKIEQAKQLISDLDVHIIKINMKITQIEEHSDKYNTLDTEIVNMKKTQNTLIKYIDLIDPSSGFPNYLLNQILPQFDLQVNKCIQDMGYNFSIKTELPNNKDKKIKNRKLNIIFIKHQGVFHKLSGSEQFVFSLAIRIALIQISSNNISNFFIIDEGFGSMDEKHLDKLQNIFEFLQNYFQYFIFISHVNKIKQKAKHEILVNNFRINH